jgi:hypothetical protein
MIDPFNISQKPAGHPVTIILGSWSSWWLDFTFSDASYTISYVFRNDTNEETVPAIYVAGRWSFSLPGATTASWTAGRYAYDLMLVRISDGEGAVLESGFVDFVDPTADRRSNAQVMVDKIDSILAGRADSDVSNYAIGSRSITKMTVKELMDWRHHYLAEVAREAQGGRTPTLRVRFTG